MTWKSRLKERFFNTAFKSGLPHIGRSLFTNTLTVLNYHRINDITNPNFDTLKANVSATPQSFAEQLDYLLDWFNIVSMNQVIQWLDGKQVLPPHAALITFDDGYKDNYTFAFPILKEKRCPAIIFLATEYIERDTPFYWDLVAYCFHHTKCKTISFPDGHIKHWSTTVEKDKVCISLIESLKLLPNNIKQKWVNQLPEKLQVTIPKGHFQKLMLTWEEIREMRADGIEFGGHTMQHPILTRISLEEAKDEIVGSKKKIEQELNETISAFAYPNGGKADFNTKIESITAQAGYKAAFTLLNGPDSHKGIKQNPFAIRRIFISNNHTLPMFATLLNGFNRYRL